MFVEFTDNVVKLDRLADVMQAGTVIGFDMKGTLEEGRISYQLRAEVMVPFVNSDPRDRGAFDLTNFDIGGKLGLKLFEWASLNYEMKVVRMPQLVDAWQVQNNLLLTFNYAFFE